MDFSALDLNTALQLLTVFGLPVLGVYLKYREGQMEKRLQEQISMLSGAFAKHVELETLQANNLAEKLTAMETAFRALVKHHTDVLQGQVSELKHAAVDQQTWLRQLAEKHHEHQLHTLQTYSSKTDVQDEVRALEVNMERKYDKLLELINEMNNKLQTHQIQTAGRNNHD